MAMEQQQQQPPRLSSSSEDVPPAVTAFGGPQLPYLVSTEGYAAAAGGYLQAGVAGQDFGSTVRAL
eukprot:gene6280-6519_t